MPVYIYHIQAAASHRAKISLALNLQNLQQQPTKQVLATTRKYSFEESAELLSYLKNVGVLFALFKLQGSQSRGL